MTTVQEYTPMAYRQSKPLRRGSVQRSLRPTTVRSMTFGFGTFTLNSSLSRGQPTSSLMAVQSVGLWLKQTSSTRFSGLLSFALSTTKRPRSFVNPRTSEPFSVTKTTDAPTRGNLGCSAYAKILSVGPGGCGGGGGSTGSTMIREQPIRLMMTRPKYAAAPLRISLSTGPPTAL